MAKLRTMRRHIGILLVPVATVLAVLLLSGLAPQPNRDTNRVVSAQTGADMLSALAPPPPVETGVPTFAPFPSPTPVPTYTAAPELPLTRPPAALSLPRGSQPAPNLAWAIQTDNNLSIWVGTYTGIRSPSIQAPRSIVRWNAPLEVMDLVPSPDGQSIAVLTFDRQHRQNGDMQPNWLWVVDLRTNNVQSLPDYAHYDLFKWYYYGSPGRILGWLDGDRIAVQRTGGFPVIARRDGSSYDEVTFPQGGVGQVALSPDRTTFFTDAFSRDTYQYGLWLNNVDGSNARLLLDGSHIRPVDNPQWSPDGRFVSFGTPKQNTLPEGTTQVVPGYRSICLLDVTSRTLSILGNEDSWDADPQWSSDSATLAFLRAPAPVANDGEAYYGSYEKVGTHLYSVDIRDSQLRPRQVLPRAGNTSILKWMPDGGLLLASTLDAPENQPRVSVFSPGPGSLTTLVSHSPSETAVHPVYISR